MSKDYELQWAAHPNIYQNRSPREFKFYFSEPEQGVNRETGLLLLIPGFGASADSKVYKKMRSKFADEHNLITVQCDYFGQSFMQESHSVALNLSKESLQGVFTPAEIEEISSSKLQINKFVEIAKNYNLTIPAKELLDESPLNFNDMGIMQAIDNITAVYYIFKILEDNKKLLNTKKVILYGHSHGAYLSYLCNALAPGLFSLLIDNSSWLFPAYLKGSRFLYTSVEKMTFKVEFDYLASKMDYDEEFLNLSSLYRSFANKCRVECFHGTNDNLISHIEKARFCNMIENCTYHEISEKSIDGKMFKSNSHGLDANFIHLFDYVFTNHQFEYDDKVNRCETKLETTTRMYKVEYIQGMPNLTISHLTV